MKSLSIQPETRNPSAEAGRAQAGFSILEIMVTLVVLSTGLLGVANLQVDALRGNQGAYLASVAAQQAEDMVERMQSNPVAVAADAYDALDTGIPSVKVDCQRVACTPSQLVRFDHNRWNAANQTLLPGGAGQVVAVSDGIFLIGVRWRDPQLAGASGWQADTEAAAACGQPQADTRCFFLRYQA